MHARTGCVSQAVEKVKNCEVRGRVRRQRPPQRIVAARGRKPIAPGKLLILNITCCREQQTSQTLQLGAEEVAALRRARCVSWETPETAFFCR
jgi:hypothetical protein